MSKISTILVCFLFALARSNVLRTRFRRQYHWGATPYYENGQYYESQPWSNQYQNNQNYYSPYFYGYQHQQTFQTSNNQNSYQSSSSYNRPSYYGNGNSYQGYATAPPSYNSGSYARPKYLATMEPKPTLSPVVLERSAFFVTQQPEVISTTSGGSGRHPTFLERLGVAVVPTKSSEELEREKALASLEALERGQELLPERSTEELEEDKADIGSGVTERAPETTSWEPTFSQSSENTETTFETSTEQTLAEKDEKTSNEFFETSSTLEEISTTTIQPDESTTVPTTATEISTTDADTTTEITTTITSEPTTTTTESTTTTEEPTTTTTLPPTTVTTTTVPTTTKEVEPVTLLAFQEVTNEVVSSASNITQPSTDQDTSDLNETGEGSGGSPFAATGIVGFRAPPLPKRTDPEKVGLEVVEWTDSDNEVRKVLSQ